MSKTKRLFLALVIADEVKHAIDQWRAQHMLSLDKPAVPAENYHVTLVYMGAIETTKYSSLIETLHTVRSDNFSLTINKTEYWQEPRIIHIAPSHIPPKLIELQRNINKVVKQVGLPWEKRTYKPHITLYRKVTPTDFELLEQDGLPLPHVEIPVDHFALFESFNEGSGVHYRMLESFELNGEFA